MKTGYLLVAAMLLAACGGGGAQVNRADVAVVRLATGPISRACLGSDRSARNPRLCGCIQSVANRSLSGGDQRRAAGFYDDPHVAQEIRQSDRRRDEAFWDRYKVYAERSERVCRGL